MPGVTEAEAAQLEQTIEMFEVITQSQPQDYQSLEILKEAYFKLDREEDVMRTSKRIAEAYVQLGQLSSAILEYESILQRFPDDPDVREALADIENKASNFAGVQDDQVDIDEEQQEGQTSGAMGLAKDVDDGKQMMHRIFVEGKILSQTDFDKFWVPVDMSKSASEINPPFIQVIAEKAGIQVDDALKAIIDRARCGFLQIEKYDVDIELVRSFPSEICKKWCILPFDRMSKSILVATCNPFNKAAIKEMESQTPSRLIWYLVPPNELTQNLSKLLR